MANIVTDFQSYYNKLERRERGVRTTVGIQALHIPKQPTIVFDTIHLVAQHKLAPKWSEEQAYGKMDPMATYSHTGRSIKFDFTVFADNDGSLRKLTNDVNMLAEFNYPSYVAAGGRSPTLLAPPFFRINLLDGKYIPPAEGYITDISISPGSSKDITTGGEPGDVVRERIFQIEFNFIVMHVVNPGWHGEIFEGADLNGGFLYVTEEISGVEGVAAKLFGSKTVQGVKKLFNVGDDPNKNIQNAKKDKTRKKRSSTDPTSIPSGLETR
tara:strand:- start:995 stop:1801 length:807 start_codon:yes stop_codon:yes gene_type:complete